MVELGTVDEGFDEVGATELGMVELGIEELGITELGIDEVGVVEEVCAANNREINTFLKFMSNFQFQKSI